MYLTNTTRAYITESMCKPTFTATALYNNLDQIHHGRGPVVIVIFNPIIDYRLTKKIRC